jgi:hypothetical protein
MVQWQWDVGSICRYMLHGTNLLKVDTLGPTRPGWVGGWFVLQSCRMRVCSFQSVKLLVDALTTMATIANGCGHPKLMDKTYECGLRLVNRSWQHILKQVSVELAFLFFIHVSFTLVLWRPPPCISLLLQHQLPPSPSQLLGGGAFLSAIRVSHTHLFVATPLSWGWLAVCRRWSCDSLLLTVGEQIAALRARIVQYHIHLSTTCFFHDSDGGDWRSNHAFHEVRIMCLLGVPPLTCTHTL